MDRNNRLFGHLVEFDEAFPELEDATIEWTETEMGRKISGTIERSVKEGGLIRCSNPLCYRGGFEIDSELAYMVRKKQTSKQGHLSCEGDEGSPKGRIKGRSCLHGIEFKITVKYKSRQ